MVADASKGILVGDAQAVRSAGGSALYARILVLERADFRVHGEANDPVDLLEHGHASRKFEPHRLLHFRVSRRIAALAEVDRVVFFVVVEDCWRVAVLVGALRVGADGARLRPRQSYLVVLEVNLTSLLDEWEVTFDLCFHLQLAEHVQTHESAVYRHPVVR